MPPASLHDRRNARCFRLSLRPPFSLLAFCTSQDAPLENEALATPLAPGAQTMGATAFFRPPGGTDFRMLKYGGPPGETGCAAFPNGQRYKNRRYRLGTKKTKNWAQAPDGAEETDYCLSVV